MLADAACFAEFFLRQFCDAHTCSGGSKPFPKGGRVSKFLPRKPLMSSTDFELIAVLLS